MKSDELLKVICKAKVKIKRIEAKTMLVKSCKDIAFLMYIYDLIDRTALTIYNELK